MFNIFKATTVVIFLVPVLLARADQPSSAPTSEAERATESRLAWWRAARFGMFVHWGPVSLQGTEIGWSRGGERRGTGGTGQVPVEIYDNLYTQFNPVKFDADAWVRLAKDAGMKYLVFTTKHHDGFVNFDSKLTDYKITAPESPFRRDIVAELADACHRAGLRLGFYYSPPDWHHPDYRTENHGRYIEYLHGQVRELCTHYGHVDIIWFDGLGGKAEDWNAEELFRMIRRLQPDVIINNRAGLPADHDTPEQRVGAFQIDRPWETCMTLCRQWSWRPDDEMKSLTQCIHTLVRTAGGDGNFLFNVGPMPDGQIEPRQAQRLREMGRWLDRCGESIYGTRGGPFKPTPWCASTRKGNVIYLHILDWVNDEIRLPAFDAKVVRSSLLTGGEVTLKTGPDGIIVAVPDSDRREIDTIVVLGLDGPAEKIAPLDMPSGSLAFRATAEASNVFRDKPEYAADKAVDDDPATRWATDAAIRQAWLAVDLDRPHTIRQAVISEAFPGRVQAFELQYMNEGKWIAFHKGTTLGDQAGLSFPPVTAQQVRIHILDAKEGPSLQEFQLFGEK
jgi:alpha-L-fucosidase